MTESPGRVSAGWRWASWLSPWLLIGLIGPWQFLVGIAIAGAVAIGVAGWLVDGDHVTIERD